MLRATRFFQMPKPLCYMCNAVAMSREHVPPRNLFPEASEVGGMDYRVNLITVPSCEEHNSAKSHDDEFLMVSLAGIIGNNSIGYMHKLGKVDRAIRASANHLLDQVLIEKTEIHRVEMAENKFIDIIWGTPDVTRLKRCFEHIAHGLHQHHFKVRFVGKVHVLLGYLLHKEHNAKQWSEFIKDRVALDLGGKNSHGSNQAVFYYQVTDHDQFGLYMMRLCFYGGLDVYVGFTPEGSNPPQNITTKLIEQGIRTVITIGEKAYEFNPEPKT